MTAGENGRHAAHTTDEREAPDAASTDEPPMDDCPDLPPTRGEFNPLTVRGRLKQDPIRLLVIPAAIVGATLGILTWAMSNTDDTHTVDVSVTPTTDDYPGCVGVEGFYAVKGTDCRDLPIVTDPGALGPPNTGGPAGGTDWVPAFPGSNVWLPKYQVGAQLFVKQPGSRVPVPEGYDEIGRGPNGLIFYWRPNDVPPPA